MAPPIGRAGASRTPSSAPSACASTSASCSRASSSWTLDAAHRGWARRSVLCRARCCRSCSRPGEPASTTTPERPRTSCARLVHYVDVFSQGSAILDANDPEAVRRLYRETMAEFEARYVGRSWEPREPAIVDRYRAGEIAEDELPHDILTVLLLHRDDPGHGAGRRRARGTGGRDLPPGRHTYQRPDTGQLHRPAASRTPMRIRAPGSGSSTTGPSPSAACTRRCGCGRPRRRIRRRAEDGHRGWRR